MSESQGEASPSRGLTTKNSTGSKEQQEVDASRDSNAFFGENWHRPKSELSPNTFIHPAETFPWLPKEEYFQRRDQHVAPWVPIGEKALSQNPQFTYRNNPDITHTVARLFPRALFVAGYLKEYHQYDKSIPIKVLVGTHFTNNHIGAEIWPFFYLRGSYVHNYFDIAPSDVEHLRLVEMQIYMNMNKLGADIEEAKEFAKQLKQQGEPKKDVDVWQTDYIERLGIDQECGMVEEMAHAFYFINAAQDPGSLRKLCEEAKQYPRSFVATNRPPTQEEQEGMSSSSIEQDAVKWVNTFMRRYYPDYKI